MQVKEIMSSKPRCCTSDNTLQEVARIMAECDCGAIPVVDKSDSQKPIGIITDRDIACRAVAAGKDPKTTRVQDCMTTDITCVPETASVEECCDTMEQHQVRRLLVSDGKGHLCGIVAQADVARHLPKRRTAEVVGKISEPA